MRVRRWLRRSCFAAAAVVAGLAVVAPSFAPAETSANPPSTHPPQFKGDGYASAVEAEVNTDPQQVVPEIFKPTVPWSRATFGSGNLSQSEAAAFDPGALGTKGVSLLCTAGLPCEQFPGFPPPFPLKAEAEYPFKPDAAPTMNGQTFGGGPFSMTLGETLAHAGADYAQGSSVANDILMGATGGPETAVLHVGASQSRTTLSFPDAAKPNEMVAKAEARLSDVSALMGRLHFESIVSTSESHSDGAGLVNSAASVKVKGATLDGHPFEINEKGVVIDGEPRDGGGLGQLGDGLDGVVSQAAQGTVRLVGVTNERTGTTAKGGATGLLIEYRIQPAPGGDAVVGHLQLGKTWTSSFVSLRDPLDDEIDDEVGVPTDVPLPPGPGGGAAAPTVDPGSASVDETITSTDDGGAVQEMRTDDEPVETAAPGTDPGSGTEEVATRGIGLLGGLAGSRMKLFYLAWTLSMLGLALGSRARFLRLGSAR